MWIRIRAVIIEDEPLAAQYLAALLDDTCQVEVVDTAADSESGLRLCAELRPDVVFLDINLPGRDGVSLATQLTMLPQPPRQVFTTGNAGMLELRVTLGAFVVEDGPTLLHVETTMTAVGTRSSFRKFFVLVNSNSTPGQ